MNILIFSSRPDIVPVVQALLHAATERANIFRVAALNDVSRVLSCAQCAMLFVDAGTEEYGSLFDEATLRAQYPGLPIVVLDAGAAAVPALAQATSTPALLRAIRLISPEAAAVVAPERAETSVAGGVELTTRQRDVLRLLRQGYRTREIAVALGLAVPTVKSHLRALYRCLGAGNRLEAVLKAEPLLAAAMRSGPSALRVVA